MKKLKQKGVDENTRYFVDIRGGCGAVRDRHHPKYDPTYQGLHSDTSDVVEYRHGFKNDRQEWGMSLKDVADLRTLCDKINTEPEYSTVYNSDDAPIFRITDLLKTEKVEEREIIGYEPSKPFLYQTEINEEIWTLHAEKQWYQQNNFGDSLSKELFDRMIEAGIFKPVYLERTAQIVLKSGWEVYQTDELLPLSIWSCEADANAEIRKIAMLGKKYFTKEIQYLAKE